MALLLAVALMPAAPGAQAQEQEPPRCPQLEFHGTSFRYGGWTDMTLVYFAVPPENLRPYMPPEWWERLDLVAGRAVLSLYSAGGDISSNDDESRETIWSGVFTLVCGAAYDFWLATDSRPLAAHHGSVGYRGGFDPGQTYEATFAPGPTGPYAEVRARSTWGHSPFSLSATSTNHVPADRSGGAAYLMTVGDRGVVWAEAEYDPPVPAPTFAGYGTGSVTTEPGSPLARMLGTHSATAPLSLIERFWFDARVGLVREVEA